METANKVQITLSVTDTGWVADIIANHDEEVVYEGSWMAKDSSTTLSDFVKTELPTIFGVIVTK